MRAGRPQDRCAASNPWQRVAKAVEMAVAAWGVLMTCERGCKNGSKTLPTRTRAVSFVLGRWVQSVQRTRLLDTRLSRDDIHHTQQRNIIRRWGPTDSGQQEM